MSRYKVKEYVSTKAKTTYNFERMEYISTYKETNPVTRKANIII